MSKELDDIYEVLLLQTVLIVDMYERSRPRDHILPIPVLRTLTRLQEIAKEDG